MGVLIVRGALFATAIAVCLIAEPTLAAETQGCPGAVQWRFRAEMHRNDGARQVPVEKVQEVEETFQEFADFVGEQTACAAGVRLDLTDDPAPWPAGDDLGRLAARPAGPAPRPYDTTVLLRPARADDRLVGETDFTNIVLPMGGPGGQPYLTTTTHEWMHVLEHFYTSAPWPNNDPSQDAVHENWAQYPRNYDGVIAYLGDLLGGRVNGSMGMRAADWASKPLPRDFVEDTGEPDRPTGTIRRRQSVKLTGRLTRSRLRLTVRAGRATRTRRAVVYVARPKKRGRWAKARRLSTVRLRGARTTLSYKVRRAPRRVRVTIKIAGFRDASKVSWSPNRTVRTFRR